MSSDTERNKLQTWTLTKYMLGFDVESTGQCMRTNFMPRFGAALVEIATGTTMAKFSSFCAPPPGRVWEERCLNEFWLKPDIKPKYDEIIEAMETAPTLEQAGLNFMQWIRDLQAKYGPKSIMLTSDTAGFDYAWLTTALPPGESLLYLFGSYLPVFAASNFYGGVGKVTPCETHFSLMKHCCSALGIEKPVCPTAIHDHNPENDAETIAYEAATIIRTIESNRMKTL